MANQKVYTVKVTRTSSFGSSSSEYIHTGTLEELIRIFNYTLEVGASWEHEKGNKKINRNPKTIKSLLSNLQKAKDNAAANGYSGYRFELT